MTSTDQATEHSAPDVGAILEQVRSAVRQQRMARGVALQGPLERDLRRTLEELELHRVVSAHWPLTSRTLTGRAVALVNKLVRRSLRWYINPIVDQQNAFNDVAARALRQLADAYADLAERMAEVDAHGSGGASATPPASATVSQVEATVLGDQSPAGDLPPTVTFQARVVEAATGELPARFPDLEAQAAAPRLRELQTVNAHWSLGGRTLLERASSLAKRVLRQYLRWLINPIVDQQNAANGALADSIDALTAVDGERRSKLAGLRARRAAVQRHS